MSTGRFQRCVTAAGGAAALLLMTACTPPSACPELAEASGACKRFPLLECPAAPDLVPPGWNDMARVRDPVATAATCPTEDATGASQFRLARLMTAEGLPAFALKWYRLAVAKGQAEARKELANMLLARGSDAAALAEARELYRQAGEAGDALAFIALARTYMKPPSGEPDIDQARLWFGRADKDDVSFGQWLETQGSSESTMRALDIFERAARAGRREAQRDLMRSSEGMFRLARMYEQGVGVPQDDCEAITWYVAAAGGNPSIEAAVRWVVGNLHVDAGEVARTLEAKGVSGLQLLVAKRLEADKTGCAVRLYKTLVREKEGVEALAGLARIGARYEAIAPERALNLYASLADINIDLGLEGLQRMCSKGIKAACSKMGRSSAARNEDAYRPVPTGEGSSATRGEDSYRPVPTGGNSSATRSDGAILRVRNATICNIVIMIDGVVALPMEPGTSRTFSVGRGQRVQAICVYGSKQTLLGEYDDEEFVGGQTLKWNLDEYYRPAIERLLCPERTTCGTLKGSPAEGPTLTQYALLKVQNAMGCTLSIEIDGAFEIQVPPGSSTTIRVNPGMRDVQAICSYGAKDTRRVHYDGSGFVGGKSYDWKLED
jgi:TPR repeat protein